MRIDSPEAWAEVLWRLGARAYDFWLATGGELDEQTAIEWGIVDAFDEASLPGNPIARASAAMLLEHHGGDPLELAEFSRLFATGIPQAGLREFLNRRR